MAILLSVAVVKTGTNSFPQVLLKVKNRLKTI